MKTGMKKLFTVFSLAIFMAFSFLLPFMMGTQNVLAATEEVDYIFSDVIRTNGSGSYTDTFYDVNIYPGATVYVWAPGLSVSISGMGVSGWGYGSADCQISVAGDDVSITLSGAANASYLLQVWVVEQEPPLFGGIIITDSYGHYTIPLYDIEAGLTIDIWAPGLNIDVFGVSGTKYGWDSMSFMTYFAEDELLITFYGAANSSYYVQIWATDVELEYLFNDIITTDAWGSYLLELFDTGCLEQGMKIYIWAPGLYFDVYAANGWIYFSAWDYIAYDVQFTFGSIDLPITLYGSSNSPYLVQVWVQ
jgi:hypothetical protein